MGAKKRSLITSRDDSARPPSLPREEVFRSFVDRSPPRQEERRARQPWLSKGQTGVLKRSSEREFVCGADGQEEDKEHRCARGNIYGEVPTRRAFQDPRPTYGCVI